MRHRWRRRVGAWALLALMLQLVLPALVVQRAAALPDGGAFFVVCTGAGLVRLTPDGTPVDGGTGDGAELHGPACLIKQPVLLALLPASPVVLPLPASASMPAPSSDAAGPSAGGAPPLPARGPPARG